MLLTLLQLYIDFISFQQIFFAFISITQFNYIDTVILHIHLSFIFRMDDVPEIANLKGEKMVIPFLWAGLGFKEPSAIMADQIKVGLDAPSKYPLLMAVVLFALGGALLLTTLGYFLWRRRNPETVSINYNERP